MRLKRLELMGFKSFADKTVFTFDGNITGFVGPNGSGKSNVVEALKWALGEQSARRLRGSEMADMIFSGTPTRKAQSCAEVRVTFINDRGLLPVEYDEVCIARRCYRDGQSEFFLNGQTCRRKDIRSLLLDTGVGVSAYNFIEQGQVDMLIRAGCKERRAVFEEAAGINRYLAQKKEAESKLESVRVNLQRVSDILQELQHRLGSVRYQAAKARRFARVREELRRLRLALTVRSQRGLKEKLQRTSEAIRRQEAVRGGLDEQLEALKARLAAAQARQEALREQMAAAEQHLSQIQARHYGLGRDIELNEKRLAEFDERRAELDRQGVQLEQRLTAIREEMRQAEQQAERLTSGLDERRAECRLKAEEARAAEAGSARAEARLEEEKAAVFGLLQDQSRLRNQVAILQAQQESLSGRLSRQQGRRGQETEHHDRLAAERAQTERELEAAGAELESVGREMAGVQNRLSEFTLRIESLTSELGELKAELRGKLGRQQLLEELEAKAEGVGSGGKLILEQAAREGSPLSGSPGLLAGLLDVHRAEALAVEAALGQRAQAILVGTSEQAREALRLLREERKGRAEVVALEALRAPERVELPAGKGQVPRLADLVRADHRAEAAAEALLGNCFLAEDVEAARRLIEPGLPAEARVVTRDGECFDPLGVWAAGEPESGSIISRRSELAELAGEIEGIKSRLDALTGEGEQCAERAAALQKRLSELTGRKERLSEQQNKLRARHSLLSSQEAQRCEAIELIDSEIASLGQERAAGEQHASEALAGLEQCEASLGEKEGSLAALQEEVRSQRSSQEALTAELGSLRSELARLEEQESGLKALAQRLRDDLAQRERELGALAGQHEGCRTLRVEAEARIREATDERKAIEIERADLQKRQQETARSLELASGEIRASREEADRAYELREKAGRELEQLRLTENEFHMKLSNLAERAAEEWGVKPAVLELAPETWREQSPFTSTQIQEFAAAAGEAEPGVASWYAQAQDDAQEQPAEQAAPSTISLAEATALREGVLATVDDPATDWAAAQERSEKLRREVDRMGGANLDSIREQDELEARLQYLTNQHDDLDRARRHELEIIRELSKKSRENFLQTFEAVRENFRVVLRKLFGGGAGDIILEQDAEDVLEAGIEIMVRPPGKETSSISLLSGGERALSAVALLFAIFETKPSPFCILDEVDAPLDEANVGRFTALVQEYCLNTQFLVVTHNKATMSAAKTLYGLSMGEEGISQKVVVNFEEVDTRLEEMRRGGEVQERARAG